MGEVRGVKIFVTLFGGRGLGYLEMRKYFLLRKGDFAELSKRAIPSGPLSGSEYRARLAQICGSVYVAETLLAHTHAGRGGRIPEGSYGLAFGHS